MKKLIEAPETVQVSMRRLSHYHMHASAISSTCMWTIYYEGWKSFVKLQTTGRYMQGSFCRLCNNKARHASNIHEVCNAMKLCNKWSMNLSKQQQEWIASVLFDNYNSKGYQQSTVQRYLTSDILGSAVRTLVVAKTGSKRCLVQMYNLQTMRL